MNLIEEWADLCWIKKFDCFLCLDNACGGRKKKERKTHRRSDFTMKNEIEIFSSFLCLVSG